MNSYAPPGAGRLMFSAAWALPIYCFAKLPRDFLPEGLGLPIRAIAPDDPLGALEGVAFGCIVVRIRRRPQADWIIPVASA